LALDALAEVTLLHGRDAPAGFQLPHGVKTVTAEEWKAEMTAPSIETAVTHKLGSPNTVRASWHARHRQPG
jgi:hypothetical protein